jgi:hypothetical protein
MLVILRVRRGRVPEPLQEEGVEEEKASFSALFTPQPTTVQVDFDIFIEVLEALCSVCVASYEGVAYTLAKEDSAQPSTDSTQNWKCLPWQKFGDV